MANSSRPIHPARLRRRLASQSGPTAVERLDHNSSAQEPKFFTPNAHNPLKRLDSKK
jgi:hypothetical protein